jgi:arsenate reductase
MDVIIYHNPDCGTSRNTLAMIRNAGVEPHVIEYLKTPPSRDMLTRLIARMGISARGCSVRRHALCRTWPWRPGSERAQLLDAMMAHPILINRPIVVSPKGVRLCRPSEDVLDLLPPQRGAFVKEDGERVVDEHGRRVARP